MATNIYETLIETDKAQDSPPVNIYEGMIEDESASRFTPQPDLWMPGEVTRPPFGLQGIEAPSRQAAPIVRTPEQELKRAELDAAMEAAKVNQVPFGTSLGARASIGVEKAPSSLWNQAISSLNALGYHKAIDAFAGTDYDRKTKDEIRSINMRQAAMSE